ncbi:GT-D fold domain-containing glycosyltransferase [Sphingobacterium corticis]|uniref:GT-D fold domain-containing glycosyltransferase n=1 Tax=Sphingobacterium corticis TaxID=1812823 RepID=A0ABW5NGP2_9SPHI
MSSKTKNMDGIHIASFEETIKSVVSDGSSLTRFGDGEFSLMLNGEFLLQRERSLHFQRADVKLKNRLREILTRESYDNLNIKVAIPNGFIVDNRTLLTETAARFWNDFLQENGYKIYNILDKNYIYSDASITRFYMDYCDKSNRTISNKVKNLRLIWENTDVLFVEGKGSKLGLNNNLFDNVKSINRILCPNSDAFDKYEEIFEATKKFGRDKLILIALGPTATVLAYDLAVCGFRAIDLGHIDIEYEWFKMGADNKISISGKVAMEAVDPLPNDIFDLDDTDDYQLEVLQTID